MLRDRVAAGFRGIVSGRSDGQPEWVTALADGTDEGWFGPGSAAWAVHGGLPTLVGGLRALLMQTLHPAVLAGVDQHSRYADDALGRLAGTTRWLTVVTFGDSAAAERESARVRGYHRRVVGEHHAADGSRRPYRADDPDLLGWVHATFTDSFLTAHRVWGGPIPGGPDAYVREWARSGEAVGVTDPPHDVAALQARLAAYGPALAVGPTTRRTIDFLRRPPLPWAAQPAYRVLLAGAVATLPDEHRALLGLSAVPLAVARPAVATLLGGLGLALGPRSPSQEAATRRLDRVAA